MDEEVRKAVRAVVRCGRDTIERTIKDLQTELNNLKHTVCAMFWVHTMNHFKEPKYFDTVRIEEDFLCCKECGIPIGSSLSYCACQFPARGLYMIGDRDKMRSRCRFCHGIVEEDPPED